MNNKELAKLDPTKVYADPHHVIMDNTLKKEEKIDILERWAYDERELSVAEEENMSGPGEDQKTTLDEINKCLLELGVDSTTGKHPPTKQG